MKILQAKINKMKRRDRDKDHDTASDKKHQQ